jgi:ppGpp synthetase/RelA/SpoT-type nucleotidyltranferase
MIKSTSVLIRDYNKHVLLLRRSQASKRFSGYWEFPGGKLDGEESAATAIIREAQEEAGLTIPSMEGQAGTTMTVPDGSVEYTFFVWECGERPCITLSSEHDACKWASPSEIRKLDNVMYPHSEFHERYWHREQLEVYKNLYPAYVLYAQTLEKVLAKLKERWSPLAIVQSRPKSLSSFGEKCFRKADKYDDPVHQLTDLCGGRIVCTTTDEAETICRQLRSLFDPVDEDDNTATRHKTDAFGYLSVHFIVHFCEGMKEVLGVQIPAEIIGLKAEVQVRTLLQHAHSEVTHDRLYKGGFHPPIHCAREAARIAAMLETTDAQFAEFVHSLDVYMAHYEASMPEKKRLREVADLNRIRDNEPCAEKKPGISLRIACLCRAGWDWQGVINNLDSDSAESASDWIRVELGNALCQLHCDKPESPLYKRGIKLLDSVAQMKHDLPLFLEADEKNLRATALGWLASAFARQVGRRMEARQAMTKAVELLPDNPYHFTAYVEQDVLSTSSCEHIALLAPALKQAAGRCRNHIEAGIEVTRAWMTLCKIRLLLDDQAGAVEALCLASQSTEHVQPLEELSQTLDAWTDAVSTCRPLAPVLAEVARLIAITKANKKTTPKYCDIATLLDVKKRHYQPGRRIIVLAGSTDTKDQKLINHFEPILLNAFRNYSGCLVTGGTAAGVCGLAARISAAINKSGAERITLVGYLPSRAEEGRGFEDSVRTQGKDFSLLEPIQMWKDMLASGVEPKAVLVLCIGGGEISRQEAAFAWALGAKVAMMEVDAYATTHFAQVLDDAGAYAGHGMMVPSDLETINALLSLDPSVDSAQWNTYGRVIHENYVRDQQKRTTQPNLLPWELLKDDLKYSNIHQAAASVDILKQCGFELGAVSNGADKEALIILTPDEIEQLAEKEHGRWNMERLSNGWRWAERKDENLKRSPYIVSWEKLADSIKQYDREAVIRWPEILSKAGWHVWRRSS